VQAGCFGKFGTVVNLRRKLEHLRPYKHIHHPSGQELTSFVQLEGTGQLGDRTTLFGKIIDQTFADIASLDRDREGKYVINVEHKLIVIWTEFIIVGNEIIALENSKMRDIAFRVLSQTIARTNDFVKAVGFNLQRISRDFHGHWVDTIVQRKGHWQSGTLFGEDLEDDDTVGGELVRSTKKRVGFYTQYFSNDRRKVSVTREGNVTVWGGGLTREQYLQFVIDELTPYMVEY
jgi:hypothetical protein